MNRISSINFLLMMRNDDNVNKFVSHWIIIPRNLALNLGYKIYNSNTKIVSKKQAMERAFKYNRGLSPVPRSTSPFRTPPRRRSRRTNSASNFII